MACLSFVESESCVCLHTNIILSVAAQRNENTNNNIEIYERYVTGTISVYRAIGRVWVWVLCLRMCVRSQQMKREKKKHTQ